MTNPNFFWGNLLIFDRPPRRDDFARWTEVFKKEFLDPQIYHITLAWDSLTGEVGDVSRFLDHGFLLEVTAVLSTREVHLPPKFNQDLEVRPLAGIAEWEQMIKIQIVTGGDYISPEAWQSFHRTQSLRYRAMSDSGFGHWYGGFLKGELVAGLGVFHRDGLGRFQTVCTAPQYQRLGICGTLVYQASLQALAQSNIDKLVMCADPDYHAIKIYESVGFKRQHTEHGVYWWDRAREK